MRVTTMWPRLAGARPSGSRYLMKMCDARITWRLLAIRDSYSGFDGRRLGEGDARSRIMSLSQNAHPDALGAEGLQGR
jgi:hypothetical protein